MPDIGVVFKSIPSAVWCVLALVVTLKLFLLWWNSPKRTGKRRGDGKSFYGCKSYPKCRGIVNVE